MVDGREDVLQALQRNDQDRHAQRGEALDGGAIADAGGDEEEIGPEAEDRLRRGVDQPADAPHCAHGLGVVEAADADQTRPGTELDDELGERGTERDHPPRRGGRLGSQPVGLGQGRVGPEGECSGERDGERSTHQGSTRTSATNSHSVSEQTSIVSTEPSVVTRSTFVPAASAA